MTDRDAILLGIGALVLPVLTYFAGLQRGKRSTQSQRQHDAELELTRRREARIEGAVNRYVDLYHRNVSSAIHGLSNSGLGLLESDDEIRQAIERMHQTTRADPFGSLRKYFDTIDLLVFFRFVSERHLSLYSRSVESVIDQMKQEGVFRQRFP